MTYHDSIPVWQIPIDAAFVCDSQDVDLIKRDIRGAERFDSFFIITEDGDYTAIWGIKGIIPILDKLATRIV